MGQHKYGGGQGFESLVLTPEQKTKVDEIEIETHKAIIPVKAEIELKRIDLEKEMKLDKPNRDRVMKMVKDIHALELQVKQAMIDQQLNIHSILTPEQRAQMHKPMHQYMRMNMMEKHMEMHGEGQSETMKDPCAGCEGQGATGKPCPQHQTEQTDQ
jgi:Spy/CpxP family protein refolding chaperone